MKILAIVDSTHQGNTLKVASAMAEAAPVTVAKVEDAEKYDLHEYDIIGLGGGIYYGKHSKKLTAFAENLDSEPQSAFVFSTSGAASYEKNNKALVELLEKKNKTVLGSFGCLGLDKFFVFGLFGGTNKGHPDEDDLKSAKAFILDIVKKQKEKEEK